VLLSGAETVKVVPEVVEFKLSTVVTNVKVGELLAATYETVLRLSETEPAPAVIVTFPGHAIGVDETWVLAEYGHDALTGENLMITTPLPPSPAEISSGSVPPPPPPKSRAPLDPLN
jgi:hypothetical protein